MYHTASGEYRIPIFFELSPYGRNAEYTDFMDKCGFIVVYPSSEAIGKPVSYVPVELPQLVGIYESFNMPKPMAQALASFDAASARGEYELVTQDFKELTGQNPMRIEQFLAAHNNG